MAYRRVLSVSPAAILVLIFILYGLKLIPPVPLSVRHMGIYRGIEREGDRYRLLERKAPWHHFWQTDDRVFLARPGDSLVFFFRVFGPRRFTHQIYIHWSTWEPRTKKWLTSDRVPVPMNGGREEGYRGFIKKDNYVAGRWRVEVETEDERVLGADSFEVVEDSSTDERQFKFRWM